MTLVGVDVGGTFTDFVVRSADGTHKVHKRPSSPADPSEAFLEGLGEAGAKLDEVERLVHGSTVATNALIERRGGQTGLITTRGFRDTLQIGRGVRPQGEYFNMRWQRPDPLIERDLCLEVSERIAHDGQVAEELSETDVLNALDELVARNCESVAVCLLCSYANPGHEQRILEMASERYPDLQVSLSSQILPQWREYERTSTTVADAFVKPVMDAYLGRLSSRLADTGLTNSLLIMKSNGGMMTARAAAKHPISTFLSGPAAGALAGRFIGESVGSRNVLTMDMGGTSFDLSMVQDGSMSYTMESEIASGIPVLIPMIDIRTIGAGGGSIGWVDPGGGLKVGPRSAGAVPGPACFDKGGTAPTITDANLLLGRLSESGLLEGALTVRRDLAQKAVRETLAEPLDLSVTDAARGMVEICVQNMVNETRTISAEQGLDPRSFALVAAGGAGPLHACLIAEELGISRVIAPPYPGLLSASGLLLAQPRFDVFRTWPFVLERKGTEEMNPLLDEMVATGVEMLTDEGVDGEAVALRSVDMRYRGQNWELNIPINQPRAEVEALAEAFDAEHKRLYGVASPESQHEVVNLNVTVVGAGEAVGLARNGASPSHSGRETTRPVVAGRSPDWVSTGIVSRSDPGRLASIRSGPAVIEQVDSTIFVPAGWSIAPDDKGNVVLER